MSVGQGGLLFSVLSKGRGSPALINVNLPVILAFGLQSFSRWQQDRRLTRSTLSSGRRLTERSPAGAFAHRQVGYPRYIRLEVCRKINLAEAYPRRKLHNLQNLVASRYDL